MNEIHNPQLAYRTGRSEIRNCRVPGCSARAVSTVGLCGRCQNAFNNPGRADWPVVAAAVGGAGQAEAARARVEARGRAMPLDSDLPTGQAGMTTPAEPAETCLPDRQDGKDAAMTTRSKTTKALCLVPGCERPAKNRGVCGACYIHWIKHRDDPTDPPTGQAGRTRAIVAVMLPPGSHGLRRAQSSRGQRPACPAGRRGGTTARKAAGTCLPDRQARPGPQVCLVAGCDRRAKTRGVCKPCYVYAAKDKNNSTDRSRAIKAAMLPPTRGGGKRRAGAGKGPLERVSGKEPVHLPPLTDEQRHAPRSMGVSDDPLMTAVTAEAAKIVSLLKIFGVDLVEFPTPAGHRFINPDTGREALLENTTGKLVALNVQPAA